MVTKKGQDTRPSEKKVALPGAQRGPGTFYLDPDDVVLVGLDDVPGYSPDDGGTGHWAYNVDVTAPPPEDLVARIRRAGRLLQPIKVVREGDHALAVEGRDRVKALRLLKAEAEAEKRDVIQAWCLVERGKPFDLLSQKIDCNMGRKIDSPLTVAHWASQLLHAGLPVEDVSARVKLNAQEVPLLVRLLDTCEEVQEAVVQGQVPWRKCARLDTLSVNEQKKALKELLEPATKAPAPKRQPPKKVQAVLQRAEEWANGAKHKTDAVVLLKWTLGYVTDEELAKELPHLADAALQKRPESVA